MTNYNKWTKVQLIARVQGSEMETHIARREASDVTARVMAHVQKELTHLRQANNILIAVLAVVVFVMALTWWLR